MHKFFPEGGQAMLLKYAQEIARSIAEIIGYNVIITDTEGVVIGASDTKRAGSLHEQSLDVIKTNRGASVNERDAQKYRGTLPGVTYPIHSMTGNVVGSVAITGNPADVNPFALIVKKQIEILLRERELQEYAAGKEETLKNLIHDISSYIPGVTDKRMLLARAKEFGFDPSARYIPVAIDLYQFARYARKIRDTYREDNTHGPEVLIQRTKAAILNIIRSAFPDKSDLSTMTGNNKYVVLHSAADDISQNEETGTYRACRKILEGLSAMDLNAAIGIGSAALNLFELHNSCSEAWRALQLGKKFSQGPGIFNIHEYRVEELLSTLKPEQRNRFIHRHVAPFKRYRDWPDLQQTYTCWCEHNFSLVNSAKALHIHRNTLYYRLEKIQKTGFINLKDYRETMKYYLAFKLEKFIGPGVQEEEFFDQDP